MAAVPPPFEAPAPPRQSGSKLWLWVIGALLAMCCFFGIGLYFFFRTMVSQVSGIAGCGITLDAARTAMEAYATEHGGKLPPAATWQQDIAPYYERLTSQAMREVKGTPFEAMLKPADMTSALICDSGATPPTGVAYNLDVAGKELAKIEDPYGTILFFEISSASMNAAQKHTERPGDSTAKVFGQARPWFEMRIEGDAFMEEDSNDGMNFDFEVKDALDPASAKTPPDDPASKAIEIKK